MSSSPAPREKLAGGEGSETRLPPLATLAAVIMADEMAARDALKPAGRYLQQWRAVALIARRPGLGLTDLQGSARMRACCGAETPSSRTRAYEVQTWRRLHFCVGGEL